MRVSGRPNGQIGNQVRIGNVIDPIPIVPVCGNLGSIPQPLANHEVQC